MELNLNNLNAGKAEGTMQELLEAQAIIAGLEEVKSDQVADGPSVLVASFYGFTVAVLSRPSVVLRCAPVRFPSVPGPQECGTTCSGSRGSSRHRRAAQQTPGGRAWASACRHSECLPEPAGSAQNQQRAAEWCSSPFLRYTFYPSPTGKTLPERQTFADGRTFDQWLP